VRARVRALLGEELDRARVEPHHPVARERHAEAEDALIEARRGGEVGRAQDHVAARGDRRPLRRAREHVPEPRLVEIDVLAREPSSKRYTVHTATETARPVGATPRQAPGCFAESARSTTMAPGVR
jgi:hypothetical protein